MDLAQALLLPPVDRRSAVSCIIGVWEVLLRSWSDLDLVRRLFVRFFEPGSILWEYILPSRDAFLDGHFCTICDARAMPDFHSFLTFPEVHCGCRSFKSFFFSSRVVILVTSCAHLIQRIHCLLLRGLGFQNGIFQPGSYSNI